MSKVLRIEKCICCNEGTVTFREWDDEQTLKANKGKSIIAGRCDRCDINCGEHQEKGKF